MDTEDTSGTKPSDDKQPNGVSPPVEPKARFPIEYKKHDDDIRHYSTTRSALTSFLMTAGLTMLAYYLSDNYPKDRWYLPAAGILMLATALFVCFVFSYRTERSFLHLRCLWKWSKGELAAYPGFPTSASEQERQIKQAWKKEMFCDEMNIAAVIVVPAIIITFLVSASNLQRTVAGTTETPATRLLKATADASKAALEAVELARSASLSAEASMKSAAESAKSAEIAAASVRDLMSRPSNVSQPPSGPIPIQVSSIFEIQRALLLLGFDAGPIDGKSGPRTRKAARDFCAKAGIDFKNYEDQTFREALRSRLETQSSPAQR